MKPIGDNLILEKIEPPTRTKSGLYLPIITGESHHLRDVYSNIGKIVSIASKIKDKVPFKIGDKVIFLRWTGKFIEEKLIVIDKRNILAIFYEKNDG